MENNTKGSKYNQPLCDSNGNMDMKKVNKHVSEHKQLHLDLGLFRRGKKGVEPVGGSMMDDK
jgi:hypothetical protein